MGYLHLDAIRLSLFTCHTDFFTCVRFTFLLICGESVCLCVLCVEDAALLLLFTSPDVISMCSHDRTLNRSDPYTRNNRESKKTRLFPLFPLFFLFSYLHQCSFSVWLHLNICVHVEVRYIGRWVTLKYVNIVRVCGNVIQATVSIPSWRCGRYHVTLIFVCFEVHYHCH